MSQLTDDLIESAQLNPSAPGELPKFQYTISPQAASRVISCPTSAFEIGSAANRAKEELRDEIRRLGYQPDDKNTFALLQECEDEFFVDSSNGYQIKITIWLLQN